MVVDVHRAVVEIPEQPRRLCQRILVPLQGPCCEELGTVSPKLLLVATSSRPRSESPGMCQIDLDYPRPFEILRKRVQNENTLPE